MAFSEMAFSEVKKTIIFTRFCNKASFDKLEFTEIIALKLVLNICKKFNFIWILIEFSITITECNALAHTLLLQQFCFLTKTIVVIKSFTTPPCRGVIYERALYLDLQSVSRI